MLLVREGELTYEAVPSPWTLETKFELANATFVDRVESPMVTTGAERFITKRLERYDTVPKLLAIVNIS
jgi:hypothetical protein